jgi:hypothetical protein
MGRIMRRAVVSMGAGRGLEGSMVLSWEDMVPGWAGVESICEGMGGVMGSVAMIVGGLVCWLWLSTGDCIRSRMWIRMLGGLSTSK